jgi:ribosomal protein S18 acetylase RimI-like enzyme
MMANSNHHFTIEPVVQSDIAALAKISGNTFEDDRHTQMKMLGKHPYDHEGGMKQALESWLASERCIVFKAADKETGEPMGWNCWGFRGFEREEVESVGLRKQSGKEEVAEVAEEHEGRGTQETTKQEIPKEEPETELEEEADDPIARLEAHTDASMKQWMELLMPDGTKCMFICTLTVSPKFQGRGVGSALLKYGTDIADRFGVFAWVHSSDLEAAWKLYEKFGFKTQGTLDVNLDEYAPAPPPEGENAWGRYVFRYMKRLPQTQC